MKFVFLIIIIISATSYEADAQIEEYGYFSESEIGDINSSLLIDSEYFSDILTYRFPLSLDNTFLRNDKVYNLTVGSLSRTRFATQQRLKIDTQLNDHFKFRIIYNEKKDLEQSINHLVLELQYRMNSMLSLVGYTELMSEKKFTDYGTALLIDLQPAHQIRFFVTAIDNSFSKRTEANEEDLSKTYAFGAVGRLLNTNSNDFLEYYARFQNDLERRFTFSEQVYSFGENKLGFRGQKQIRNESRYFNFDVSFKRRLEGIEAFDPSTADEGVWRSRQWDILFQYEDPHFVYGLAGFFRTWRKDLSVVDSQTYLPHLWYKITSSNSELENFRLGYELSIHNINGPMELQTPMDRNRDMEHRGNLRYSIYFSQTSFLHLQFTADLDDFSWEGGNGTLQILF